jgi:Chitobiase/beta-hexosaminidase C-terminal domain
MKRMFALLLATMSLPALATTYTIKAGSSEGTIQATLNTAGSASGNTVVFSAGAYSLATTLSLPCSNGTVYTGPNVGIVTQSNLPTTILTNTVATNYALSTGNNGTSFTGNQGCTIEYLRFSGTQGGILVYYPASGITIQENAFDNNNPPSGGASSEPNIWLDGENSGFSAATGIQHISVVWNTFFNNCASIRAVAYPDSGGRCAATWVNAYNNYLTWSNNTVELTEEGLKLSQQSSSGVTSLNADVENNNLQGNSRIMIETQQDTNGVATYSHNAFYQPNNPSYNTFELSMPEYTGSLSPTHTASDDVFIGNVAVTLAGSAGHYGIGLELWGAGSIATYNLFQGANGAETCGGGWWCSGWQICMGATFTNATISNNYFSGSDVWNGVVNNMGNSLTYEESASASNAGLKVSANTVIQDSTTIATVAPTVSAVAGSSGSTVTLRDSDANHGLSIFYTADGSTPAIFAPGRSAGTSRVYTAPFAVAAGTTIRAIASWGQGANQGVVFPSFGYVPSSVVSVVVAATGRTLLSASLRSKTNASTVSSGGTIQLIAYGKYSDGSVSALPDAQGNTVTTWNTSNHNVAKISTAGHATAISAGTVAVEAMIGSLKASPWTLTVSPAQSSATQAPAAATSAKTVAPADMQAAPAADTQAAPAADTQAAPSAAAAQGGPIPAGPGGPLPDRFLGPFWRLVTPPGGSASISHSHLFLGVPGGGNHDPSFLSNPSVRVVQAIGNEDFDVAIKIDSPIVASDGNTSQGLMVLSDNGDFLTFALVTDGVRIGLNARTVSNGVATTVLDDSAFSQYQNPMYLRLVKNSSGYVAFYSIDGVSWAQAASFTYTRTSAWVGPFASNDNKTPANAVPVVMSVNWFDVQQ